ncbi:MAG TPA: TraB/GumN family protein [Paracoccaceae bacterium]|nr:TraB/GumN family protein [Paracoccaceae bacterium]
MRRIALAFALTLATPAWAIPPECIGRDLLAELPGDERAQLRAAADAVPYPRGNHWRATRDGQQVTIVGTYHLEDPRHEATLAAVLPALEQATILLVEAGPEEEAALIAAMGRDPGMILLPEGPTLVDLLEPADWAALSDALRARQMPPFMAARFRPWFVSVTLGLPPCAMASAAERDGLDQKLIDAADGLGLTVAAFEPFDPAFRIFEDMPMDTQIGMIRSTLAIEDQSEDYLFTLAEAYFAQDTRIIWELMREISLDLPDATPEQVAAEFAQMEEALMSGRNRDWIPVIEAAAADGKVVAAFGALHLAGEEGVLNLLARNGWTLERLPF